MPEERIRSTIKLGPFAGKPSLLSAVKSLQKTLDETGFSADRDITYQLDFLFCDRVTSDQVLCIEEILRRAAKHR